MRKPALAAAPDQEPAADSISGVVRAWAGHVWRHALVQEHRCAPPESRFGWRPVPTDGGSALREDGYACPECGQHFRRTRVPDARP